MSVDRTPFYHAALSIIPFTIGAICGNVVAGITFACGGWLLREQSQAEDRWIKKFGNGKRINMPWYGGFDYRIWDIGSIFDFSIPMIGMTIMYLVYVYFIKG